MTRGRFRWQRFVGTLAVSAGVHVFWVIPKLIEPLTTMGKTETVEEVTMLPDPVEPASAPSDPAAPAEPESKKPKAKKQQVAKLEPKKPELPKPLDPSKPLEPVAKVPPPPPQPPPPPIDKRKQMVSQEKFPDEKDNATAEFLAEKNHTVAEQTRTESTNLLRETQGQEHQTTPNENQAKEVGDKDQKIAELENKTGTDLPRSSLQKGTEGISEDPRQQKPGPLAMRNLMPRTDQRAEVQQRDGVERQELAAGELPMQRKGLDGERGGANKKGGKVNLSIDHHMYDNIEGFSTAEKERQLAARGERSHVKGRYDKYLASVGSLRSALENFTPDVKVGNQAELGTRASPFAAYITAMHRQIHKLWTFGFLSNEELRMGKGPFDDETLWTQIQISLKDDGTVDKLGIVRASGNTAFDAAALDTVRSAAPFPTPPSAIKSANGKVYLDWQFHRDERACGTFGVDPHILTTPGDNVVHDSSETGMPMPHRTANGGTSAGGLQPTKPAPH